MQPSLEPSKETAGRLRTLSHDLSNSLETIIQAAYLLGQAPAEENARKWLQMLDEAAHDATRINREIREILRSLG
jgi:signal transduction histidine kinase